MRRGFVGFIAFFSNNGCGNKTSGLGLQVFDEYGPLGFYEFQGAEGVEETGAGVSVLSGVNFSAGRVASEAAAPGQKGC